MSLKEKMMIKMTIVTRMRAGLGEVEKEKKEMRVKKTSYMLSYSEQMDLKIQ